MPNFTRIQRKLAAELPAEGRSIYDGDWSLGTYGPATRAGVPMNSGEALGITAVWNAITIYARAVAGMDLFVAERSIGQALNAGRRPAPDHPVYPLISSRPNSHTTSYSFRESMMVHVLTRGNAYAEIERSTKGRPLALHLIEPTDVEPKIEDDGELLYRINHGRDYLPARDVVHVKGLGWDGIKGLSPIGLFRETFGLAKAQERHMAALMGNNAMPNGVLMSEGKINDKARVRADWQAMHGGPENAGRIGLLENGMKFVETSFSPEDAELILSRNFSIAEVARIFNIPQHMLGLMDGATFSNIENQALQFYTYSLLPWLIAIEQELNAKLFGPIERAWYYVTHDANSLLRGDSTSINARISTLLPNGMMTRNEGRMLYGMPPVEGGDDFYIATNNLNKIPATSAPTPTLDPDVVDPTPDDPDDVQPEADHPLPPAALNALRRALGDAVGKMVRQECKAIRKRSSDARLDLWADEFYPRHSAKVAEAITPFVRGLAAAIGRDMDPAGIAADMAVYSRRRLSEIWTTIPPDEMAGAVSVLCGEMEDIRADAVVDGLIQDNTGAER